MDGSEERASSKARGRSVQAEKSAVTPEDVGIQGTFPKAARIRRRDEFEAVHRRGIRVQRAAFSVVCCWALDQRPNGARFGCAVSRKVGPAVVRNRLKRLMREVFRLTRESWPAIELVVVLRPEAAAWAEEGRKRVARELLPAWREACERLREGSAGRRRHRRGGKTRKDRR